jgi:hypothetical protein
MSELASLVRYTLSELASSVRYTAAPRTWPASVSESVK